MVGGFYFLSIRKVVSCGLGILVLLCIRLVLREVEKKGIFRGIVYF